MSKTLVDLIEDTLKARPGERLPARQIAQTIIDTYPEWIERKRQRSKNPKIRDGGPEEIFTQIYSEVGSNRPAIERRQNLRMTEDRPRLYYYSELSDEEELEQAENPKSADRRQTPKYSERDLYPILSGYLATQLGIFSKRVEESRSRNRNGRGGNKWLHPDLIGFEPLSSEWTQTVRDLVQSRSDRAARLWSFEVKQLINRSNVRETFFQTVSNSTWANLAYLVSAEITGTDTMRELRMLSAQHGVGVIRLDREDQAESTIVIQARERESIDWLAADRLCAENPDAEAVFRQIRVFHQSGETHEAFWDSPLEPEED